MSKVGDEGRVVDVGVGAPELHVSREKEPEYRSRLIEAVIVRELVTVQQAIYEVAEVVGISPVTARRYLQKMVSAVGPLMLGQGPRGKQRLMMRPAYWEKRLDDAKLSEEAQSLNIQHKLSERSESEAKV